MPLLDLIWVMLLWFLFFGWIAVVILVLADVFRSHDLSGIGRVGWVLLVVLIPWLGVLVYITRRGDMMVTRYSEAIAERSRDYQPRTGTYSRADQLAALDHRRDAGLVSGMDYDTQRARLLD